MRAKINPRLYNLDTEIGEQTNLADQHPDIVAKLAGKRVAPARKDLAQLKPGDMLASADAPQVEGRPFTLSFAFETKQPDAVLVAHGGATSGYAVFLRGGRAHFAVRVGTEVVEAVAAEPAQSGRITASLAADGAMALKVGEQPAATAKAPGPLARQPQEDFCVGHDNRVPVADYGAAKPFRGRLTGLAVEAGP
jgi:arylsulfatase A